MIYPIGCSKISSHVAQVSYVQTAAMGQGRLEGTLNLCLKNLGAQER